MSSKPWRTAKSRRTRHEALAFAEVLRLGMPAGIEWVIGGSWRRKAPSIGDFDVGIVVESLDDFPFPPEVVIQQQGPRKAMGDIVLPEGTMHADFWAVHPAEKGAFLMFITGPVALNVRQRYAASRYGWTLNEKGLFDSEGNRVRSTTTEEDIYRKLGLPWIPPEAREEYSEAPPPDATSVTTWEEPSQSNPLETHTVTRKGTGENAQWSCKCKAFIFRHRHGRKSCKHIECRKKKLGEPYDADLAC